MLSTGKRVSLIHVLVVGGLMPAVDLRCNENDVYENVLTA